MMKRNLLLLIALAVITLSACCKVDLAIGITVRYSALSGTHELKIIQQNISNPAEIQTVHSIELTESNQHQVFIELNQTTQYHYILQVDSVLHSDTISQFDYEIKGHNCNTHVESVSYLLNGVPKTDKQLEIE